MGKNAAVVEYSDLGRLGEGEFLNDSIIWFYMRWLQEKYHTEPNQVYIFNTHFYTALCGAKKRGISHQLVERWTRNVDLFNYDFILVPIHENVHWYLAIVCNLPRVLAEDELVEINKPVSELELHSTPSTLSNKVFSILNDRSDAAETGSKRNGERARLEKQSPEPMDVPKKHDAMSLYGDDSPMPITEHEGGVFQHSRLPASPLSNKKRRMIPRKKYNSDDPMIVILDSLHTPHQNTIQNLKDYLIAEAKSKRGIDIARDSIRGANLKHGIPAQDNFCDCGLFVCGYADKFMRDPRGFGRKMLAQEFDEGVDWPEMNPSSMRRGIKTLLLDIAREQHEERRRERREKKAMKATKEPAPSTPATPAPAPAPSYGPPPIAPEVVRRYSMATPAAASAGGGRVGTPPRSAGRDRREEFSPSPDHQAISKARPLTVAVAPAAGARVGARGTYPKEPWSPAAASTATAGAGSSGVAADEEGTQRGYRSSVDLVDP
jgi:sentrin-specific protease 7